jgi:vitamin B12 transporter
MAWGFGGNPNLKPERGRMHEAFVSYDVGGVSYRLGYFINNIQDAIVINGIFSQMENISHARIDGVEFSGIQPIGKSWTVRTNVTGQNPQNEQTHTTLARRSKVFGTTVLRYASGNFSAEAIARGEGLRYDDTENTSKLPAMVIAGFSAAYKINRGPTVRVQIDNLFDKKYQPAVGFNGIPRTVWASVSHTF